MERIFQDNLSTHTANSLIRNYGQEKGLALWNKFTIHFTPKHASWLNQAEIEIGVFSKQCIGKRRIKDIDTLTKEARAWNKYANKNKWKIDWKFTTKKAREKFKYKKRKN